MNYKNYKINKIKFHRHEYTFRSEVYENMCRTFFSKEGGFIFLVLN